MVARVLDWYFTNGNKPDRLAKQVDDIRGKADAEGRRVTVGLNAFAIARQMEAEARSVRDEIVAKANPECAV